MYQVFTPLSVSGLEWNNWLNYRKRSAFGDVRLQSCWESLSALMARQISVVVHQISQTGAEMERFYRFLSNKKASILELISRSCEFKVGLVAGRHVLVLGDTTSFNLKSHIKRISDPSRALAYSRTTRHPDFLPMLALPLMQQQKTYSACRTVCFGPAKKWTNWPQKRPKRSGNPKKNPQNGCCAHRTATPL